MINGVIFDMDGLMFDTERMWATFWEPALAALGLEYKEGLAEAERGTAGETSRNIVRQFYGEDCDANAIIDSLHRVADEEFQKPVPKKPGLDELLAWLDANHIPMGSGLLQPGPCHRGQPEQLGPDPLLQGAGIRPAGQALQARPGDLPAGRREKLGHDPAQHAGAGGTATTVSARCRRGLCHRQVPDLLPADDEMRGLYTMECTSLNEVLDKLKTGEL